MAKAVEAEVEDEGGLRSQVWRHEAFVEWCNEQYDLNLDSLSAAEIIAWFAAKRNEFRKTDFYTETVAEHAAQVEAEKEAKAEARAAAKAEKGDKPAKKASAKKATAKKATKATKTVKKAVKKASKASDDNPFD